MKTWGYSEPHLGLLPVNCVQMRRQQLSYIMRKKQNAEFSAIDAIKGANINLNQATIFEQQSVGLLLLIGY